MLFDISSTPLRPVIPPADPRIPSNGAYGFWHERYAGLIIANGEMDGYRVCIT